MSDESSFLHPQYDLGETRNTELPPSTHDNVPRLNGHQTDANYASTYRGHWTRYHDNQYHGNQWYEGPPPPAANLEEQYTYQRNTNFGYPAPGNAQPTLVPPGPSRGEYYIPPAHDLPTDGVRDRPPPMPDVADPFSRSVPAEFTPSRMLAMERLKGLADLYLHDPGSRVGALRMGLSPSGGRLRVMIVLDIDV